MSLSIQSLDRDNGIPDVGKRYTAAEKDAAYLVWRTSAGRSVRKVSQRTGISEPALYRWRDELQWEARANDEDRDDFGSSRLGVVALVVNEQVRNIEAAVQIRDDKSNSARDRLAAAQWLSALGGVAPVAKVEHAITNNNQPTASVVPDFDEMSIEELRAYDVSHSRVVRIAPRQGKRS